MLLVTEDDELKKRTEEDEAGDGSAMIRETDLDLAIVEY